MRPRFRIEPIRRAGRVLFRLSVRCEDCGTYHVVGQSDDVMSLFAVVCAINQLCGDPTLRTDELIVLDTAERS